MTEPTLPEQDRPHIRIFPHDPDRFTSLGGFVTWLLTAFKAYGGEYWLLGKNRPADLPQGSIVLFRYADVIVGEAVLRQYDITPDAQQQQYTARCFVVPSSIRVYAPPISIDEVRQCIGPSPDITVARTYHIIRDWAVYAKLLAQIAERGMFM